VVRVRANLIVAGNGMTTLNGSSRPLSNPEDRRRFHALRKASSAVAIGGSTFRSEPYSKCPLPLFVATTNRDLAGELSSAQERKFLNLSPLELVKFALKQIDGALLIEGGVSFLRELIEAEIIDELQITRVETHGDGHPFDDLLLQKYYRLLSSEDSYQSKFEIWAPRKSW